MLALMQEIPLSKGFVALIDDEDLELVSRYKWRAFRNDSSITWYARAYTGPCTPQIFMHALIMGSEIGKVPDHKDGDGLNNRRGNLRFATTGENGRNRRPNQSGSSNFKGVTWRPKARKWQAEITKDRKKIYLGIFEYETDAARAYNYAATKLHGEFSRLNQI